MHVPIKPSEYIFTILYNILDIFYTFILYIIYRMFGTKTYFFLICLCTLQF
uniref:Uncharacterized protein n=1 Tax=Anguilla anguilla TaxID=7936 RepID=A0A0E9PSJ4_ANGAN